MNILVFDTCLDKMYVVLRSEDKILSSKTVENTDTKYHSAFLISTIASVLKENNLSPKDVDVIGTNIGPGSFTGIRACLTVAKVMAHQLGIKAIGVSSLEILSQIELNSMVALDARKNKAYVYYDNEIKGAIELDEVKELAKTKKVITDNRLQPILGGITYYDYPLGEILSNLVLEKYKSGNIEDLKPLYIQPPPVSNKM